MSERTYGGARKISINSRPKSGSKSQRPARRRHTPSSNAVVFSESSKHHSSTNFPLFSNNLVARKPPVTQAAKLAQVSARNQQLVGHVPRTRAYLRAIRSPAPVEEPPPVTSSQMSLSSVSSKPSKPEVPILTVSSQGGDNDANSSPRSQCHTPASFCSELDYDPDLFPFQYLPDDCKLKVFSFLPIHDKGRCAQVCVYWRALLKTSSVWSHVAFSDFPFWCITTDEHNCIGNCYIRYRVRVKQFLSYLKELRPILRSLEFKFDIGEKADGFLQPLENLIDKANTKELKYASMNWKETPMRPFWTDSVRDIRCDEVMQKHRLRQRHFVSFFDLFTMQCPKVETLVVPFDWSDKSVDCLLRLQNLRSLVLEKYFVFQKLCQDLIDRLLIGLPCLKQLMLEVWTPSGHGLVFFALVSKSVEYLDISQSRGFYLNTVHLPKLKTFRVARHPWNGPLVLADRVNVPCIYDVLAEGSPKLEKINEHYLKPTWRDGIYQTLEEVLRSVCSCKRHKSGWAM
ncbi:uncharacterized protein LOC123565371 [Mercenaria mercenaria]|uniref:uncharacterized protein LOC123565371 n=1 Tax=Mercenaria mercenaria TaxID=6596 RepID=UPI00234E8B66|nr:uncharacterized protein LOC123565371 [Mercenaria mercenaria]XP_053405872.1 uncharacterized protein LOC123565371 [Mercenaria mercenaria]